MSDFVTQTEAAAVIIAVSITVSVAAALDFGKNSGINILILVVAGNVIGGSADFTDFTVDFFFGDGDDFRTGDHGQTHLAGGVKLSGQNIHLGTQGIAHGYGRDGVLEGQTVAVGFQGIQDPGVADNAGCDDLTAVGMDSLSQCGDLADTADDSPDGIPAVMS